MISNVARSNRWPSDGIRSLKGVLLELELLPAQAPKIALPTEATFTNSASVKVLSQMTAEHVSYVSKHVLPSAKASGCAPKPSKPRKRDPLTASSF